MSRQRTILITGGAGFIGAALVDRLKQDRRVRVLDNFTHAAARGNPVFAHPNVTVLDGDVRDIGTVATSLEGVTEIVHLAAIAGVGRVTADPFETMTVTLVGTLNLLECARERRCVRRFVDVSTSEVYGRNAPLAAETGPAAVGPVGEPRWSYAASKLAAEHLCHAAHRQWGLPVVSIRPFNIYGPGQLGEGAVHRFISAALADAPLALYNGGRAVRAWCYIDDLIDALVSALQRDDAVGRAFNIGNPTALLSTAELARAILRLTGSRSVAVSEPWPHPEVTFRSPSIDAAASRLGFAPRVALEEGLMRTIEWYRNRGAHAGPITAKAV